jgi:hypothetical protein
LQILSRKIHRAHRRLKRCKDIGGLADWINDVPDYATMEPAISKGDHLWRISNCWNVEMLPASFLKKYPYQVVDMKPLHDDDANHLTFEAQSQGQRRDRPPLMVPTPG